MKTKSFPLLTIFLSAATLVSGRAQTTFTKITQGAIVTDKGHFPSCAWADFNNDGFLDLAVNNYGGSNLFYLNNRDGTFTKITGREPDVDTGTHFGIAPGDYDNDGNADLFVSVGIGAASAQSNSLYHNLGDAIFASVQAGDVANAVGYFALCAWADYDNDGFLDLFVANDGDSDDDGGTNFLFHNNGDSSFTQVTSGAIVSDVGAGWGGQWADYDNDGFIDLVIVNNINGGGNFLYHNNGDGTFTAILTNSIATDVWPDGAQCAAWGDYDNDGLPDLFVTAVGTGKNQLYHNNGHGSFTNVISAPMLQAPAGTFSDGAVWGDYDNDGYLDLFLSSNQGKNQLFHNNGDGTFTEIFSGNPVEDGSPGMICNAGAWVDYDNDGFLDLFVTRNSQAGTISNLLYHNNSNSNAWLEVKLVGTASNRSGIGAKVRAHATIGGKTFWQMREITHGGGFNVVPLLAHFGLGDATNVDELRIEWPSGIVQTLTNVAPRQILTVVEHQPSTRLMPPTFTGANRSSNGVVGLTVAGAPNLLYVLEGSTNLVDWRKLGVVSNATGSIQFTDSRAANYATRFYRVSVP